MVNRSRCITIQILSRRSCTEILTRRSLIESVCKDLGKRSLKRDLAKESSTEKSCQGNSWRELVQGSCLDTSCTDLAWRPCIKICCRDLAKRLPPIQEISYRDLAKRSPIETLFRIFIKRPLTEILPRYFCFRELVQRSFQGISCGDCVQRPCIEISYRDLGKRVSYRDLAWRSILDSLNIQEISDHCLARRSLL